MNQSPPPFGSLGSKHPSVAVVGLRGLGFGLCVAAQLRVTTDLRRAKERQLCQVCLEMLCAKFTLGSRNYREAFDVLIPKAIQYSAGLINFLFRARITAKTDAKGNVVVRNIGAPLPPGPRTAEPVAGSAVQACRETMLVRLGR